MFRWSCRSALAAVVLAAIAGGGAASAASAALPDGRAYEMVSPPDKNGADIAQGIGSVRAADAGGAVAYDSTGGFDSAGTGTQGETTYISRRGTNAWSTKSISVAQASNVFALGGSSYPFLSDDLTRGILFALDPVLTPDAEPGVKHLYLRNNETDSYMQLDPNRSGVPIDPATNNNATNKPGFADATPDFGHVIFEDQLALTPGAPNSGTKLYEWDHGTLRLASILPDGTPATLSAGGTGLGSVSNNNTDRMISDDGSRIFFTGPLNRLYMRESGTSTVMINASENTTVVVSPTTAIFRGATPDGGKVIFTSTQRLADADVNAASADLYMYDTTRPSTDPNNLTLLSPDNDPSDGGNPNVLGVLGMSDDGSYVYFAATGKLVSGQPATSAANVGLYLWHDGVVSYIASIGASSTNGGNWSNAVGLQARQTRLTVDGKHLLFSANAPQPGGYDNAGKRMFYLYDANSGETSCVTCNPDRTIPAKTDAGIAIPKPLANPTHYAHLSRALSPDGRWVLFHSGDALVPADVNQHYDVYEYDALTGKVALISSGQDANDSLFADASSNRNDVYFLTRSRLVGWDKDDLTDLYDAKVGGGLPEPPPPPSRCIDDDCQGSPSSSMGLTALGTMTFSGDGSTRAGVPHRSNRSGKVTLLRRTIRGSAVVLTLRAPGMGRLTTRGSGFRSVARSVPKAGTYTLTVRLTTRAKRALVRHHRLKVRVRVGYVPARGKSSSTTVTATVKA